MYDMKLLLLFAICMSFEYALAAEICMRDDSLQNTEERNGCFGGWELFQDNCYLFGNTKQSWINSRTICKKVGGSLSGLTDAANFPENNFIKSTLKFKQTNLNYWSSLTNHNDFGKWFWNNTGNFLKYDDWEPGQPSYGHCAAFDHNVDYRWKTYSCDAELSYICKRPLTIY